MSARVAMVGLLVLLIGGCASGATKPGEAPREPERRAMSFAIQLAYDEAQPGCVEMTSRRGEKVYVAPRVELDRSDLEVARALHSAKRDMLQVVLNYTGRRALEELTRAQCQRPPAGVNVAPEQKPAAPRPPRLAMLINGELVCAPYVDRVVGSGEIQIIDVYSAQECEDIAAALNWRSGP